MTTHELAKILIEMPDVPVWGDEVGQGSCEREDFELQGVKLGKGGKECWLAFFPMDLNPDWNP